MSSEPLAELETSAARRAFGVGTFFVLGLLLIYLALFSPPVQLGWQIFLLVLGAVAIVMAEGMRRATKVRLILTEQGLFTDQGETIAELGQIERLDRGTFAMKPSNGFILRLKAPAPRAWAPGIWWRLGRRVGVGGVTSAHQCKTMAEIITVKLSGL